MAEPPAADGRRRASKRSARYREREDDERRDKRLKVSYTEAELEIVREAAARDIRALAAWIGDAALNVAKEKVVPVSVDARDVVAELIEARRQVARIGNNLNQLATVHNTAGVQPPAQVQAAADATLKAIQRLDEATLQVMRERRQRS
ncbi:MobC family plasmid mobilization relaxosome protein (plasmid) [Streptomyces sp. HU2014]|uniref:plasmid mobilization protein n=1 Tax=Streptomyces sp. HU2014 TaxID=2939414 RepID=UPI00200D8996|nr:plasmid mobilization relaxosome protein MobC [Streptomyces sp. HU2014]UQI49806.1 MobC family plasmid mobilization relaxosome protein [Streptomyces sp. HU2014]